MLKVNVYAFWKIDQYPFYSGGEVCELLEDGRLARIVNRNMVVEPVFCAFGDHGRKIVKALKDLHKAGWVDIDVRKNARNNIANQVFSTLGFPKTLDTLGMSDSDANKDFLDRLEREAKYV